MNNKESILIDIGGTSIIGGFYNNKLNIIENIIRFSTPEYKFNLIIEKIYFIIDKLITKQTNYIGISLNGQINDGYVFFSRILGGTVNLDLGSLIENKYGIKVNIENDVNCMVLGYNYLSKNKSSYSVLLNLGTGIRTSYVYKNKLLKGDKGFFGEIRDTIYVKELEQEININDLVCGRGISNIYEIISGEKFDAKYIYDKSIIGDINSIKTIDIFIKYFINIIVRISYSFNPEEIIIDGSLKSIIKDKYEKIIKEYDVKCEQHFKTKIIFSEFDNIALYGALNI